MQELTKKLRTRSIKGTVLVSIQEENSELRFKVPVARVYKWIRSLESDGVINTVEDGGGAVPADDVFKHLDKKYTRPGVAIRGARGKEGMSQATLAKRLGIPQGNLSKMENGKRPIGRAMAKRLAQVLNINYRIFL